MNQQDPLSKDIERRMKKLSKEVSGNRKDKENINYQLWMMMVVAFLVCFGLIISLVSIF
ncbi:hypothetical protein [Limosilactobacillus equigenerosi]|uniref:DUF4044 domain-containing protein n=1 Tax=Limosilactobacillus equigenerosi DSM 18793 = JCM 14505 TaxID=1423742 RepID=A0A0R1UFZ0_9LACO|nr:hypothetical protein [Limosilactobacillus equigenerosi]KRL92297.1 hypothetical protein FC21_GL000343 [Limosilactobacillus equigenerosi DSM 18793 = JCM 14505]